MRFVHQGALRQFGSGRSRFAFSDDRPRQLLPTSEIYCAVQTCYSYALWLGALRHTHASAAALVRQFAGGAAELARVLERAATRESG